jgi:hypothetical protein
MSNSNLFAKRFFQVLREDARELERKAMEGVLDDGTNPEDFEVDMTPDTNQVVDQVSKQAADAMSQKNQQMIDELQSWIDDIESFLKRINSEDPNSIQSRLAAAEPDTVMDKMKQSQQTKISRVAADLASLHQNFLGFMSQTANSRYKYVAIPLAFGLSLMQMGMNYFC